MGLKGTEGRQHDEKKKFQAEEFALGFKTKWGQADFYDWLLRKRRKQGLGYNNGLQWESMEDYTLRSEILIIEYFFFRTQETRMKLSH